MDWKEFLKPNWKKVLGGIIAYCLLTVIVLCMLSLSAAPSMYGNARGDFVAILFLAIFGTPLLLATAVLQSNLAGFAIVALYAVFVFAVSYLLACALVRHFQKKPVLRVKKR